MAASVRASIQMYNGMTPALKSMQQALNLTISSFERLQAATDDPVNLTGISAAKSKLADVAVAANEVEQELQQSTQESEKFKNSMKGLGGLNLTGILSGIGIGAAIKEVVELSDTYTQTYARLNLINDGLQTTSELQTTIYNSAQRARAAYQDTAAAVSKLGLLAGNAFTSVKEIVSFTELMNKNFKIAGASATEQASAMYQLTQAMASGRLQGDEYRSIIENAPLLAEAIEDYMVNVEHAKGSMKDWASEGLLTANVIKAALFSTADEVDERFLQLPMTWSDVWTSVKNEIIRASTPLLKAINLLAQNWSVLEPIIIGVISVLGAYLIVLATHKVLAMASAAAESAHAAALMMQEGATFAATAAQLGLNSALLASPVTWVILAIIALIAVIYAVVAAINKVTGSSISATGIIAGAFAVAGAIIFNTFIGITNAMIQAIWSMFVEPFLSIIEFVLNVANGGFTSFGGAVANLIGQIISWFLSLGEVVTTIIDAIFGTNWTGGLESLRGSVLQWGKNETAITLDRSAPLASRIDYGTAWDKGYGFGQGIDNKVSNYFNGSSNDYGVDYSSLVPDVSSIADNTGSISDSLEQSDEYLELLTDLAEREAINRFTTAEVKVDFTTNANISSDMDIDGVINVFTERLQEAIDTSAEGVPA